MAALLSVTLSRKEIVIGGTAASSLMGRAVAVAVAEVVAVEEGEDEVVLEEEAAVDPEVVVGVGAKGCAKEAQMRECR